MLSPQKTVLLPNLAAGCSLADSIDGEQLRAWKAEHPGAVVVAYVNTTAEVKAGSDIVFEVHYTPNGKAVMDRTKLGLVFAKEPPKKRVQTLSAVNGTFKIPPGDPNYRVDASFEIRKEVILASIHPHMHARGKDFEYRIVFPGGETRTILSVRSARR